MRLSDVDAFILAGGLSRRMGTPKGLLQIDGETILERVARTVGELVARVSIVTDREGEVAFLNLPVVRDTFKQCGPLGGLHAALGAASSETVFVIASDLPFVSDRLIRSLWSVHNPLGVTVPATEGRIHPLCGFYTRNVLPVVESRLQAGELAMRPFLAAVGAKPVPLSSLLEPVPDWHLLNVNTPQDLAAALAAAGGSSDRTHEPQYFL